MTLRQLSDKVGVDAIDLVGDEEAAQEWMDLDISHTIFYQEIALMPEFQELL